MRYLNINHLANGFSTNELYGNLVDNLTRLSVRNSVVCFSSEPASKQDKLRCEYDYLVKVNYVKKPLDRFFYFKKIKKYTKIFFDFISDEVPNLIHAHTLYSDGAVAYKAKRKFNIPYIVAVRNADLNVFAKWRPDLSNYRDQILLESEAIILISPVYKTKLHSLLKSDVWLKVINKIHVVPNGIDDFWHSEKTPEPSYNSNGFKLLYVGDFSKNKNVQGLLTAFSSLDSTCRASLTIVGGGGDWNHKIKNLIEKNNKGNIEFLGIVKDKYRLRDIYRTHDLLVIPSFHETFGLAYVEALSQGVPCVHSRGEGIDGYFDEGKVSAGCDPYDAMDIKAKILEMVPHSKEKFSACLHAASDFKWSNVASKYKDIYEASLR